MLREATEDSSKNPKVAGLLDASSKGRIIMRYSYHAAAVLASIVLVTSAVAADNPYAEPAEPGLPPSDMELDFPRVALLVTDPQIDFLSEDGVTWDL